MITVYTSLILSIIIQAVSGIVEFVSLFAKVPLKYVFLKQMMLLEVVVQVIEGSFYIYWFKNFKKVANVTPTRYFDWVITTPTMLVNLIFYLIFLHRLDTNTSDTLQFVELFKQESTTILPILLLNWAMLLFGYLSEICVLPVGVLLGFIPFLIYYYIIYHTYVLNETGFKIFIYFFFFWMLYGCVAILPYKLKNICYNILDIFSKNFFGIFLSYLIFSNMY